MGVMDEFRKVFPETPESRAAAAEARLILDTGCLLHRERVAVGLTQTELAAKVGTTQSGIARLEDPDYGGLKLRTLARLFYAMGLELVITTRPIDSATDAKPAPATRAKRATAKTSKATERTGKATVAAKKPTAQPTRKAPKSK
jgi:transcriptional regulator with XRE-family HTH domain